MGSMLNLLILVLALACGAFAPAARAAEGGYPWDRFPEAKLTDRTALQNGAKVFVNYCLSCHSAQYMRFNRLKDIGLTDEQIKANFLFATDKVGEVMRTPQDPKQAKQWFGANPPDLTVIARSRSAIGQGTGPDYLWTLWRTYYRDEQKATGWNNLAFPDIGMPHALWQLQGERRAVFAEEKDPHDAARTIRRFVRFEQTAPGQMDARQYEETVGDLVAYLAWMAEPARASRMQIGVGVLIFLGLLVVMLWRLSAAYWKDVK
jgi:ubiquinol-cytochrome c reductase cytochrome c1 subunit